MTSRTLYVVVRGQATDDEDAEVPGIYMATAPDHLSPEEQCEAVLDAFHGKIAIGMVEDFSIAVVDEDGASLPAMESYDGSLEGAATFLGGIFHGDAPAAVAARLDSGSEPRP